MYKVDLVLTLDDRDERPSYNRHLIPKLTRFINYPVNVIVSLHKPSETTLRLFEKYRDENIVQKLHVWHDNIGHMPKDLNRVFITAFNMIESEWICHFNGDMFAYRKGYDNWLEHMIRIIESGYHNIGAICHTMPYNRFNPFTQMFEPRRQVIQWVSTRFFVTRASTVKSALNHPRLFLDWPDTYSFEGTMYLNGLQPQGLISVGIPFNPNFLIVHVLGMAYWTDHMWDYYEDEMRRGNENLLRNIAHSDWGDIHGGGVDCREREVWGRGSWQTSGNDGEAIEVLPS